MTLRREGDVQVAADRLSHSVRRRTKTRRHCRCSARCSATRRPDGSTRQLVETGKAPVVFPAMLQLRDPGMAGFCVADEAPDNPLDAPLALMIGTGREARGAADHRRRGGARAQPDPQADRPQPEQLRAGRPDAERLGGHGRLAAAVPPARPAAQGDHRGRAARLGAVLQAVESHRAAVLSDQESASAPTFPRHPDVLALVKDYKGDAARTEGEEFDPSPANHRGAHTAREACRVASSSRCCRRRPAAARCSSAWRCAGAT